MEDRTTTDAEKSTKIYVKTTDGIIIRVNAIEADNYKVQVGEVEYFIQSFSNHVKDEFKSAEEEKLMWHVVNEIGLFCENHDIKSDNLLRYLEAATPPKLRYRS